MKDLFIHTIQGYPANYIKGHQISYRNARQPIYLVKSLAKIKADRKASNEWRKKHGYEIVHDYGFIRLKERT